MNKCNDHHNIENCTQKRKINYQCPNPLFVKWLTEWRDEAIEKGLKLQHTYSKALKSLEIYPLPLKSPWEAKHLSHFGNKICAKLEEKLKEYNENIGEKNECETSLNKSAMLSNTYTRLQAKKNINKDNNSVSPSKPKQKRLCNRKYVPAPKTGGYALIITLMENEIQKKGTFMKKQELMDTAQLLCDASFTRPEPGSHYTAWSTMSNLIRKHLVIKYGNPAKYSLTEEGRKLAVSLMEADYSIHDKNDVNISSKESDINRKPETENEPSRSRLKYKYIDITGRETDDYRKALQITDELSGFNGCLIKCNKKDLIHSSKIYKIDETRLMIGDEVYAYLHKDSCDLYEETLYNTQIQSLNCNQFSITNCEKVILYPGTFDIVLVIDNCEVCTGSNDHKMAVLKKLMNTGVKYDIRKLNVGDFLWVARKRTSSRDNYENELILDYVVERKRMDDLARSIIDGRFREQKFRMKRTGIKHPVYLVEEYGTNQYFGLPDISLKQAIVNCQVIDGFLIIKTKNMNSSVNYLVTMTQNLQNLYNEKKLISCNKEEYMYSENNSNLFITFDEFQSIAVKQKRLTIKEMFGKHLLQLCGISADKAYAIVNKYSTPAQLIEAYQNCSSLTEKESLLSEIRYGKNKRRIGPMISKTVYQLYSMEKFK